MRKWRASIESERKPGIRTTVPFPFSLAFVAHQHSMPVSNPSFIQLCHATDICRRRGLVRKVAKGILREIDSYKNKLDSQTPSVLLPQIVEVAHNMTRMLVNYFTEAEQLGVKAVVASRLCRETRGVRDAIRELISQIGSESKVSNP